jgi:hypothetical protein
MRPTSSTATLRRDLAAAAMEYDADAARMMFIGQRLAPLCLVGEPSAKYPILTRENFLKTVETRRAKDGRYNRSEGEFDTGTYDCEEHGLEAPLDDAKVRRYASFFDMEQAETRRLYHNLLLDHERRVRAAWTGFTAHAATTAWANAASAVPIQDILTGCRTLEQNCGMPRSMFSLAVSQLDFQYLSNCASVTDRIKYSYPGILPGQLTAQIVAAILGIKEVLVAGSAYDTKEEGITPSLSQVWASGSAWLAVLAAERSSIDQPSAARTFLWTGDSPDLVVAETYREEGVRGDVLRVRQNTDEALTAEIDLLVYEITTTG